MTDAYVALKDGRVVEARARAPGRSHGELVFTTAYTGYEESLTDPSYEEQVLTFSYPLIGNYGVREERFESERVHPRAVVADERVREGEHLLLVTGVGERLLVAGVGGGEHEFPATAAGSTGAGLDDAAVLQRDVGVRHYEMRTIHPTITLVFEETLRNS